MLTEIGEPILCLVISILLIVLFEMMGQWADRVERRRSVRKWWQL